MMDLLGGIVTILCPHIPVLVDPLLQRQQLLPDPLHTEISRFFRRTRIHNFENFLLNVVQSSSAVA